MPVLRGPGGLDPPLPAYCTRRGARIRVIKDVGLEPSDLRLGCRDRDIRADDIQRGYGRRSLGWSDTPDGAARRSKRHDLWVVACGLVLAGGMISYALVYRVQSRNRPPIAARLSPGSRN